MSFSRIKFSSLLVFFAMLVTIWPLGAWAGSFSVKPAKQEVVLSPGDSFNGKISVSNNLGFNSYFSIRARDIELPNRSGGLFLSDFLSLSNEEIFVASGETREISFKITVLPETLPGGAYGYLEISALPNPDQVGEAKVSSSLGSVIFLRIDGLVKEGGELLSFGLIGGNFRLAIPFPWHFSFKNTGNIYLNPYGKIFLKNNWTGGEAWVDAPPLSVLPGQTRLFEIRSSALGFPGHYSATLLLNRGYKNLIDSQTVSFWFVPWPLLVFVAIILLGILFLIIQKRRKKNDKV